jgi:hypothetical protein
VTVPRVWALGDSWTDPRSYPWNPAASWLGLLADRLGFAVVNSATSGCGYVAGTPTFGAQAAQGWGAGADLAVVFGSVNDANGNYAQGDIQAAATVAHRLIRRLCPGAPLLVIGPQWGAGLPFPAGMPAAIEAVRAATAADGDAAFVDPSQWLLGRPDLARDQWHANTVGHVLFADRLEHDVALLLTARPTLRA